MLLGEIVILRGQEFVVNLIIFDMLEFDMILNMDFLTMYRVKIN